MFHLSFFHFPPPSLLASFLTRTDPARQSSPNEIDIAGANAANWSSVLVRTGVYDPEQSPPTHEPTYISEDVGEAVDWAINREMERVRGGS